MEDGGRVSWEACAMVFIRARQTSGAGALCLEALQLPHNAPRQQSVWLLSGEMYRVP